MATATNVTVKSGAEQFRGVFGDVFLVRFTLDVGSIGANSTNLSTVAVPGIRLGDMVLAYSPMTDYSHVRIHDFHVGADNELHILIHNDSGGTINPNSREYKVVIARPTW